MRRQPKYRLHHTGPIKSADGIELKPGMVVMYYYGGRDPRTRRTPLSRATVELVMRTGKVVLLREPAKNDFSPTPKRKRSTVPPDHVFVEYDSATTAARARYEQEDATQ